MSWFLTRSLGGWCAVNLAVAYLELLCLEDCSYKYKSVETFCKSNLTTEDAGQSKEILWGQIRSIYSVTKGIFDAKSQASCSLMSVIFRLNAAKENWLFFLIKEWAFVWKPGVYVFLITLWLYVFIRVRESWACLEWLNLHEQPLLCQGKSCVRAKVGLQQFKDLQRENKPSKNQHF